MKNRNYVLFAMGFEVAALNYFVSSYQNAAWFCVVLAVLAAYALSDFKKITISSLIVLMANGLFITLANQFLSYDQMIPLFKIALAQSVVESLLLTHFLTHRSDSKIYFRYSMFLFISILFFTCIAPYFMIQNKLFNVFVDAVSFVPMMIISAVGYLAVELTVDVKKKEMLY